MHELAVGKILLCAGEASYWPFAPSAALIVLGLLVLTSGILLARSASRRTNLQDPNNTNPPYVYSMIILLIIAGCFLTTFGVAFVLTFTFGC